MSLGAQSQFARHEDLRRADLLSYFLPNVVAGNMWALMLDFRVGVINDLLVKIGMLDAYKAWFADPNTAMGVETS